MHFTKVTRRALVGGSIALGILATGASAQDPAPLDPPQEVKVAYVPIMKFGAAYVAEARGLFDKHGLDVTFEPVKSGTEAIAFLDQGSVDVGGIAIVTSLWNGWHQGMDLKIIAPGALEQTEGSATGLYVRKDLSESGAVTSIADLAGKRVATAGGPGSGGEYLAAKALERGGLTIRDVELMNVGNPDMPQSVEGGAVDAAVTGSPFAEAMLAAGSVVPLEVDLAPGLMTVAFVASSRLVEERPEVAERFVLALAEATRLMQGDAYLDQENIDAYLTYTSTTEDAIRTGSPMIFDTTMAIPLEGLADVEATHRGNGRTEYEEALDLSVIYDDTFVKKAVEALGN